MYHLPTAGEIVLFDRSWYNRAGVERVMGFADDEEYERVHAPGAAVRADAHRQRDHVTKFWFSVTQSEQRTRFIIRQVDPVRQWKLSPIDLQSLDKWDDYTAAKEEMFRRTDTDVAPWITIKSNDKKRARINAMRYFLAPARLRRQERPRPRRRRPTRGSSNAVSTPSATDRRQPEL